MVTEEILKVTANAATEFDRFLGGFMEQLRDEDLLIITADHGCDPAFTMTTDHTMRIRSLANLQ